MLKTLPVLSSRAILRCCSQLCHQVQELWLEGEQELLGGGGHAEALEDLERAGHSALDQGLACQQERIQAPD